MTRDDAIRAFLDRRGLSAEPRTLAGDASARRFLRIPGAGVLMDSAQEELSPFIRAAEHIAALGLSAPRILAADPAARLMLVEDLGDSLYPTALAAGADEPALYAAAAAALRILHAAPPPAGLPRWDAAAMTRGAEGTFLDWWWPAMFGAPPTAAVREEFRAAMLATLAPVDAGSSVFTHRDYFAGNLVWLPDRSGAAQAGILDMQDAALGHPAYDLVSLLEDARRRVGPAALKAALDAYGPIDADAGAACACARHVRVAGLWVRLQRRDAKPGYLRHGPWTWTLLANALRQPACAPMAAFFDRHVPPGARGNPA